MNRLFMISVALVFSFVGLILAQQPNRPLSIDSFTPSLTVIRICPFVPPSSLSDDLEVTLIVNATDPDGDSLDYEYSTTEATTKGAHGFDNLTATVEVGGLDPTCLMNASCSTKIIRRQQAVAPQFTLKDLNGRTVRLSDYQGKVVLINFWATWCPPCRAEMPDLVRLQREHGKEGLQIIGVTYPPEQKARVSMFARRLKVNYPIILGTREFKARFSSEETLPLTVVINRDGKVSDIISGILLREEFDEKIKPLLIKEN